MSIHSGCVGDGLGSAQGPAQPSGPTGRAASPAGGCAAGAAVADAPPYLVTDESTGASFEVAAGQVVLDGALAQGVELAHGCRNGVCGACAIEVVEGAENAERPDAIEANSIQRFRLPRGTRLACRLRLQGRARIRPA